MVQFAERAQVELPSDREVLVTREFQAPRALVYQAFTRPELVRRWLQGAPGWSMTVCDMDTRVGGRYTWRWRSDEDGSEFGFHGEFLELDPPSRIRYTEHFDPGTLGGTMGEGNLSHVTTTFEEVSGRTRMSVLIDFGSKEGRDAALSTGMTDGMEISYQHLDALLAEQRAA